MTGNFVSTITNPYFPLTPGTTFHYRSETPGERLVLRRGFHKSKVTVPYGQFDGCLRTLEYTPLEPGSREHKFYCSDIGLVLVVQPKEGRIRSELISITHF